MSYMRNQQSELLTKLSNPAMGKGSWYLCVLACSKQSHAWIVDIHLCRLNFANKFMKFVVLDVGLIFAVKP